MSDWQLAACVGIFQGIYTSSFNSKWMLTRWEKAWENALLVHDRPPSDMISNWENSNQRKQNVKIKDEIKN